MELKYQHLLGKPWVLNKADCLTLTQGFFMDNFGIEIPDISRPNDWNSDVIDLFRMLYPKCGFQLMDDWDDLRPADVLCTSYNTSNPNHLVIYVGDNKIIHHRTGMNSQEETYRPAWKAVTGYVLRHPDVPDLRPQLAEVNIEDIIRARFRLEV